MITSIDPTPRYVSTRYPIRIHAPSQQCPYCGSFACNGRAVECLACGAPQCHGNGLGSGHCAICYVGLLPGWSGTDCHCQRAHCSEKAVATIRKRNVCARHAEGHVVQHLDHWQMSA